MSYREELYNRVKDILIPVIGDGIEEIYLSIGHSPGVKPGIPRSFPETNPSGGDSLNLRTNDGPREFPKEEDF